MRNWNDVPGDGPVHRRRRGRRPVGLSLPSARRWLVDGWCGIVVGAGGAVRPPEPDEGVWNSPLIKPSSSSSGLWNAWKTGVGAGQRAKTRVDEPVVSLWESRTACGQPICPHTSSTVGHLVVHTAGPVVHSYPQMRAQQTAPSAVHRLCTTHRFHSPSGINARHSAVCGEPLGAVVERGSPDHAHVTTHRSPVDDCGQLDPHAVYEALFRGHQAASRHSRGLYPQFDALRWASLWISVDEAEVDVAGRCVGRNGRRRTGIWVGGEAGAEA